MKSPLLFASSLFTFVTMFSLTEAQITFPLYDRDIPNSRPSTDEEKSEIKDGILIVSKISRPTLTMYRPFEKKANGTAVIICPGGGYWVNAIDHEGSDVAKEFAKQGVTAFALKYRIPNDHTMVNKEIGPLQDLQRAIQVVRARAKEWNIRPDQVGVMGFSAGGHLASTAATHYQKSVIDNPEEISLRPDFLMLIYSVISFQETIAHQGSVEQLLEKNPSKEKLDFYSNELHVNAQTPPTFLVHASDDDGVKPANSIVFYEQLIANHVPAELHIYQKGGHGFGMNNKGTSDKWMDRAFNWMAANHWLK